MSVCVSSAVKGTKEQKSGARLADLHVHVHAARVHISTRVNTEQAACA